MAGVGSFNKGSVGGGAVTSTSFSFNTKIDKFQGSAANADGRIIETDIMDFNLDNTETVITPEKFAAAVGIRPVSKAESILAGIGNFFAEVGATAAVITTSVTSGVLKLGEKVLDGVVWVGATAGRAMGFDTSGMREFIARDLVGEANEAFYENTDLGRMINDKSAMKYDSDLAKGVQNVSEKAAEIAAATALTVCTCGVATFAVGTVVGLGSAAESTYQNNGVDTTVMQELGIAGSGVLTGLSWMANGKLGQGAINLGKDIAESGAKEVLGSAAKHIFNKDFITKQLKNTLSLRKITENGKVVLNFNALMNYVSSAFGTGQSLVPYITGEEEFNATAALKIGRIYLTYLGLNVLEDVGRDYLSDYKAGKYATDLIDDIVEGRVKSSSVDEDPIERSIFGFLKKKSNPPQKLNFNQWVNEIYDNTYSANIDGVNFRSKTQEGLNSLMDYYQSAISRGKVNGAYFSGIIGGKGLTITDIPNEVGAGAYQWGDFVFFDEATLRTKPISTFYHECGHFIDAKSSDSERALFLSVIQGLKDPSVFDFDSNFNKFHSDYNNAYQEIIDEARSQEPFLLFNVGQRMKNEISNWDQLSSNDQAQIIRDAVEGIISDRISSNMRDSGYAAISDIFDAISEGKIKDSMNGLYGHGGQYYSDVSSQYKEVLANISDLYNGEHMDMLDRYFPEEVRILLTDSYEKLIDVNALKMKFLNFQFSQDAKYGKGNFDLSLIDYIVNNNPNALTRTDNIRGLVTSMPVSSVQKYLTLPENSNRILTEMQGIVDQTRGDGYFLKSIQEYLIGNYNSSVFTRDNNVRQYIELLGKDKLFEFVKSIGG